MSILGFFISYGTGFWPPVTDAFEGDCRWRGGKVATQDTVFGGVSFPLCVSLGKAHDVGKVCYSDEDCEGRCDVLWGGDDLASRAGRCASGRILLRR